MRLAQTCYAGTERIGRRRDGIAPRVRVQHRHGGKRTAQQPGSRRRETENGCAVMLDPLSGNGHRPSSPSSRKRNEWPTKKGDLEAITLDLGQG